VRVDAFTSLSAGRWFCGVSHVQSAPIHPARREFAEPHPSVAELLGGAWSDSARRSLADVFAQHFHEPSLGELPLQ